MKEQIVFDGSYALNDKIKIATISLNVNTSDLNYGAVLHSYAMQQFLSKESYVDTCEILDYIPKHLKTFNFKYPFISYFKNKRLKSFMKSCFMFAPYSVRRMKFQKFIEQNLKLTKIKYNYDSIKTADLEYDVFICESDVIWAEYFCNNEYDDNFFLNFPAAKAKRKIAYAPSISTERISQNKEREFLNYIQNIDAISLREKESCDYLKDEFDLNITHCLDPVFLLNREDYLKFIKDNDNGKKYVFLYLPVDYNPIVIKHAKAYAKKHNLEIIEFNSSPRISFYHKVKFDVGIEDFLTAIYNADCVFTNSFHALCFSLIFQKNFYAFDRNYSLKIYDLLNTFNLINRYNVSNDVFVEQGDIDFGKLNEKLKEKINFSKNWVRTQLMSVRLDDSDAK